MISNRISLVLEFLGLHFWSIVGAFWSVVTSSRIGFRTALISFLTGFIVSILLTDVICDYFHWTAAHKGAIGFILGLTGMNLTTAGIRITRELSQNPMATFSDVLKVVRGKYENKNPSGEGE